MSLLDEYGEGIHAGIPEERYHERVLGEASSGVLKLILAKSLRRYHYWATEELDDEARAKEKAHFVFGRAYHCAVVEPARFEEAYIVEPHFGNLQSSKVRLERAQFHERNKDRGILSASDLRKVAAMAKAVREHPNIGPLFTMGEGELTLVWRDRRTGLPCKARLDWLNRAYQYALDPKSCTDASEEAFARTIHTRAYHLQAAHYVEGCRVLGVYPTKGFHFVAQEKEPPYEVALYELEPQDHELGWTLRERAMDLLARGMETGRWPGLNNDKPRRIALPAYAHYTHHNSESQGEAA